jgi:hypothetical protein
MKTNEQRIHTDVRLTDRNVTLPRPFEQPHWSDGWASAITREGADEHFFGGTGMHWKEIQSATHSGPEKDRRRR